jgi:LemA protein
MMYSPSIPFGWLKTWTWLGVMVLVGLLSGCKNYDSLVAKNEACDASWADYEAQLQRRADLIPSLVNVVKGSTKHEESVLTKVTAARAEATKVKLSVEDLSNDEKVKAFEKAQSQLGSMGRLLVSNESYPDLKGNKAFENLQVQLEGTENRILRSREQYNAKVKEYNTELSQISGQVVNKATGKPFQKKVYFSAVSEDAKVAPKVTF